MRHIFWITALMFFAGGSGLIAYALDAKKPALAAVFGALALGATIAFA